MKRKILIPLLVGNLAINSLYSFSLTETLHNLKQKAIEKGTEVAVEKFSSFKEKNNYRLRAKHLKFPINPKVLFNAQNCNQIVKKKTYTSCYDYSLKISKYEIYNLDGELVGLNNLRNRMRFYDEPTIPKKYRAYWYDYVRSGFDRGHIRSDGSTDWNIEALKTTYSMVNIWAQTPTLNRKVWSKVEKYSRYVARKLGDVNVLNIAEIPKQYETIGKHKIAVPTGFYKIIYNEDKNFRRCFYFKNIKYDVSTDKLRNHVVDCNKVYYK